MSRKGTATSRTAGVDAARPRSSMRRVVTAAVLVPLLWVVIKIAPLGVFLAAAGAVVVVSGWECYGLMEGRGRRPLKLLGVAGCVGASMSLSGLDVAPSLATVLVAVVLIGTGIAMATRPDPAAMLDTVIGTLFPVVFVGLTLAFAVALRRVPGEMGEDLLMLLFVCVIATDTAAYYVGRAIGRRPLAPRLSPRKTREGAVGGVLGSVLAAAVAHAWFYQRLPLGHAVALGVLLSIAAIVGDLAESTVKRAAGAKDASGLLPGHGGVLDRIDGLLFAAPVLYYYHAIFL